jgi:hypothetical protein
VDDPRDRAFEARVSFKLSEIKSRKRHPFEGLFAYLNLY